ncbi:MAG: hypothetical protein K8U03_18500 [Planctomycetia bacterium]|nr:hypothetical protein [Planctomycetia bacterium]
MQFRKRNAPVSLRDGHDVGQTRSLPHEDLEDRTFDPPLRAVAAPVVQQRARLGPEPAWGGLVGVDRVIE